jgi:hypothetical protein
VCLGQVGSVNVDVETHITGVEANSGVGVRCDVIEELSDGLCCGVCAFRLFGGNGTERDQHGAVYGASIEEKGADNFLNACDF